MRALRNHTNLDPAPHWARPHRGAARLRSVPQVASDHASRRRAALPARPAAAVTPASVESDPGLGLLFRFLIATAVAFAAFMLAVAVDEMWILVPVMAVHLFVTFVVLKGIFNLLKD